MKADETTETTDATCPYCGHRNRESYQLSRDEGETECGICLRNYWYSRRTRVTYTTRRLGPLDDQPLTVWMTQ